MAPDLDVPGGVEGSQQGVADDVHQHWEAVDGLQVAQHSEPVALQRAGKQGENSWLSSSAGKQRRGAHQENPGLKQLCLCLVG